MDVRSLTVGQVAENCYLLRQDDSDRVLIVDPGDEAERIMSPVRSMDLTVEAILITHCHFDHIGAVAPVARETGAPVYCPEIEVQVLANIMDWVPGPFGPFESYDADETVAGGETLELAGFELEVISTPGHSPGHVTYSVQGEEAIFSGDVESIRTLVDGHSAETTVYPGHMGLTTLGAERSSNPFLAELAS
jgi:hydroxyacylglutathione hydrolase